MKEYDEFKLNILAKLQGVFTELEFASKLREPDDQLSTWILNVLHTEIGLNEEEVMGEYFFLPLIEEASKYHMFRCSLSLSEEVSDDKFEVLGKAANLLNFLLPIGSFVFSQQDSLMAFFYTALIPVNTNEEEALELIDGFIGLSLHIVDQYVDAFMGLSTGEMTLEDFIEELPPSFHE